MSIRLEIIEDLIQTPLRRLSSISLSGIACQLKHLSRMMSLTFCECFFRSELKPSCSFTFFFAGMYGSQNSSDVCYLLIHFLHIFLVVIPGCVTEMVLLAFSCPRLALAFFYFFLPFSFGQRCFLSDPCYPRLPSWSPCTHHIFCEACFYSFEF